MPSPLSLAPRFNEVAKRNQNLFNRFNGFPPPLPACQPHPPPPAQRPKKDWLAPAKTTTPPAPTSITLAPLSETVLLGNLAFASPTVRCSRTCKSPTPKKPTPSSAAPTAKAGRCQTPSVTSPLRLARRDLKAGISAKSALMGDPHFDPSSACYGGTLFIYALPG